MTDIEKIVKIIENNSPELATEEILLLFSVSGRSKQLIANEQDAFDRGYTKGWIEGFNSGKVDGD
jgi:hypothetical protein